MGLLSGHRACTLQEHDEYIARLGEYAAALRRYVPTLRLRDENQPSPFWAASPSRRRKVLDSLRRSRDVENSIAQSGEDPHDARVFVRHVLRIFEAEVPDGFTGGIDPTDVVECYDRNYCQFLRNLRFFEVTSFTLEQLYFGNFMELTKRPRFVVLLILKESARRLIMGANQIMEWKVPTHRIQEVNTPGLYEIQISMKRIAKVIDREREIGFMTHNHSERIASSDDPHAR